MGLMSARRHAQLFFESRAGSRKPSILANSIPKSGTHLVKAVLQGAGYRYAGHYGDTEHRRLRMVPDGGPFFATAHTTLPVTGPGRRLLIYRDPAEVAVSMAAYIRTRRDHPRHIALGTMALGQAVEAIFAGIEDLEPLAQRYQAMWAWALASQALAINFAEVRQDPAKLLERIGTGGYDPASVARNIGRWNPTKRTKKDPAEKDLVAALRASSSQPIRETFDVYQEIQSSA